MKVAAAVLTLHSTAVAGLAIEKESSNFFYLETFEEDVIANGKWIKSTTEKYVDQKVFVKPSNKAASDYAADKGLRLADEMSHYGISTLFSKPFKSSGKDLVLQYEVKLEEGLNCGGAYLKFLRDSPWLHNPAESDTDVHDLRGLDNNSPFSIMFGPDNCGVSNNQVHFIMQHRTDANSPFVEKFYNETPPVALDSNTHLYTLAIHRDSSVEFFVDMQPASDKGSLFLNMNPPLNPPREIDDPTDVKPADWVDDATYPDPKAVKPADWDDDAPAKIPNPTAVKPSTWDDSIPVDIADPTARKPAQWDDEEDGEWEAQMVPNPLCETTGCGVWKAPMITNPAYRGGKWKAPLIANPSYKGVWKARQIPNPDTSRDDDPLANMEPIVGVAVEVWTTVGGIHLDNILISESLEEAFEYARKTFVPKQIQEGKEEAEARRLHKEKQRNEKMASGEWKDILDVYISDFSDFIAETQLNVVLIATLTVGCMAFSSFLLLGWGDGEKEKESDQGRQSDAETSRKNNTHNNKGKSEFKIRDKDETNVVNIVDDVDDEGAKSKKD